ncbi:MAG: hypothetical protein JWM80_1756 [Cyanobacteria bacterium RYN_339]|nr:hypothetical protein [Cyanobacteria bacterium RYN_339]
MPVSQQSWQTARTHVVRGGRVAYDVLDFTNAAKNTYASQDGWERTRNGSATVQKYRKLKADAGYSTSKTEEKFFGVAGDAAAVSGLVISAIALPKLASQTATSFRELNTLIHDPNATGDQRLNKAEETIRAGAGTIFSTQGVVVGTRAAAGILARNRSIAEVMTKIGESKITRFVGSPLGKALNVLLPIADGAVFIGETIALRRTFQDPTATSSQKLRKVLDFSLAGIKTAFWLVPGVTWLKTIYGVASFAQLGLSLYDFRTTIKPHFEAAVKTTAWAIGHPLQATASLGKSIASGIGSVVTGAAHFTGWLFGKVAHPGVAVDSFKKEYGTWNAAYLQATGKKLLSQVWPGANNNQPQQVAMLNPAVPGVSPVAAPVAAPAPIVAAAPVMAAAANPPANVGAVPPLPPPPPPPAPAPVPPAPLAPPPPVQAIA